MSEMSILCCFLLLVLQFCQNVGLSVSDHEKIISWWEKMSVQKPVQCELSDTFEKPFPSKVGVSKLIYIIQNAILC